MASQHSGYTQNIDGVDYSFHLDGSMANDGWLKVTTSWGYDYDSYIYLKNGVSLTDEWLYDNGSWYYFNSGGLMLKSEAKTINGKNYAFNENGSMRTDKGWKIGLSTYNNPEWTFVDENGEAVIDSWKQINSVWYNFSSSGTLNYNHAQPVRNQNYAYGRSGAMLTNGWNKFDNRFTKGWVYSKPDGQVSTGWFNVGNTDYFASKHDSVILTGSQIINNRLYIFDSSGRLNR